MAVRANELLQSFNELFPDQRLVQPSHMLAASTHRSLSKFGSEIVEADAAPLVPRFSIQQLLRPAFGKGEARPTAIGNHPDFAHLAGTHDSLTHPIVTLFMDIESSTRLELLYEPAQAATIKNTFLCAAIELVHAFDGHVHRLQGDAVMAFFGGRGTQCENAVIDSINCATALWLFVKQKVIPTLRANGFDEDFGIRVGIDYAPNAFWRSYGYPGVDEVTASGFGVSAAAKLQHCAGRNQIMVGQELIDFIDLPDVVTNMKRVQRNGKDEAESYLTPNIIMRDGQPHNYSMLLINSEEYLKCGPLADTVSKQEPLHLKMSVCKERNGQPLRGYSAASFVLPKNHWIRFDLSLPFQPRLPYTVRFDVENHGRDAGTRGGESLGNHFREETVSSPSEHRNIVHWETTAYRGLHYLIITVRSASGVVSRRRVGVYIE